MGGAPAHLCDCRTDRLIALAHAIEPLMMLTVDAEQAIPPDDKITIDGLLRIRLQLTRYRVWLFDRADGASR